MAPLSDAQVSLILDRIIAGGVSDTGLRNELLDHYCCFIEEKLITGIDFELAYNIAFQTISPNGMQEIQEELYFILNFNQQTIMKRFIYGFGFLAVFCLSTGTMIRSMHWTGTAYLMFPGFVFLALTTALLFSSAMQHRSSHTAGYNIRVVAGFIAMLLIAIGGMFKILQYPTANLQMLAGMMLLNFIFLPMFFYQLYRHETTNSQVV
jgi:hypothetical protein